MGSSFLGSSFLASSPGAQAAVFFKSRGASAALRGAGDAGADLRGEASGRAVCAGWGSVRLADAGCDCAGGWEGAGATGWEGCASHAGRKQEATRSACSADRSKSVPGAPGACGSVAFLLAEPPLSMGEDMIVPLRAPRFVWDSTIRSSRAAMKPSPIEARPPTIAMPCPGCRWVCRTTHDAGQPRRAGHGHG